MSGAGLSAAVAASLELRILFGRQAESTSNAGGVSLPHHDTPLTEKGRRQANRLAQILPAALACVLASPMIGAHQTAAPYCVRIDMAPQVRDDLTEFSMVDFRLIDGFNGVQRNALVQLWPRNWRCSLKSVCRLFWCTAAHSWRHHITRWVGGNSRAF